jgi:hypothetical protein
MSETATLERKPQVNAPTTRKEYEVHPLANIFPTLDGSAFDALVEDIRANGQQQPVVLFEGKILDGRNRYLACRQLGSEVRTTDYLGSDPIGCVLSANLHRRHLNESQRAMVAGRLTDLGRGANQHTKQGTSIDVTSQLLNVGRASVERARKVLAAGDPALIKDVEQGRQAVSSAANTVKAATKQRKGQQRRRQTQPLRHL